MPHSQQSTACRHQPTSSNIHPCARCFVEEARLKTELETNTFRSQDGVCPVCLNEYNVLSPDTERVESPVRLKCGHRIGYDCLLLWLSPAPEGGNGNTCPICKYQLFAPRPSVQRHNDADEQASAQLLIEEARAVSRRMLVKSVSYHQAMGSLHPRVQRMPAVRGEPVFIETKSPLSKLIKRLASTSANLHEETRH